MTPLLSLPRWASALVLVCLLVIALLVLSRPAQAQTSVDLPPLTLAPGQSARLPIQAFCLEYGKTFAPTFPPIVGPADSRYVNILRYALSKGYTSTYPYQVQLALWRAATGRWVASGPRPVAEEIYANAGQAPGAPGGFSLWDAIQANAVRLDYDRWTPITSGVPYPAPPWLASGEIVITNITTADLTFTVNQGLRLDADPRRQDMIFYFQPPTQRPTPTPTATPTATPLPPRTPTPPMPPTGEGDPGDWGAVAALLGALAISLVLALDILRRRRTAGL